VGGLDTVGDQIAVEGQDTMKRPGYSGRPRCNEEARIQWGGGWLRDTGEARIQWEDGIEWGARIQRMARMQWEARIQKKARIQSKA
jgi:hypothetical protein